MEDVSIRTLILEFVDARGASHIQEMYIEILQRRPGTPEHTIRARLSETASEGLLNRLGDGFYDVYVENEAMTSVVCRTRIAASCGASLRFGVTAAAVCSRTWRCGTRRSVSLRGS